MHIELYRADACFSKHDFVSALTKDGIEVYKRLRDGADLLYLYNGAQAGGRGRPRKYNGKILYVMLREDYFVRAEMDAIKTYFQGIVY